MQDVAALDEAWRDAQAALTTPYFAAVSGPLRELDTTTWPSLDALNALAQSRIVVNAAGDPIRFVDAGDVPLSAMAYEARTATTGEVPTRANFHDLFNALQWLSMPRSKAATNAAHLRFFERDRQLVSNHAKSRSAERDVLTMFDESGVIVISASKALLDLIRTFQWHELFVVRRDEVCNSMQFWLTGHGLLEKSLRPFVGLTAKAMLLQSSERDLVGVDCAAARWLADDAHLQSSRQLAPLPLLGIPGWDARNEEPAFYQDASYFRPGYTRDMAAGTTHSSPVR